MDKLKKLTNDLTFFSFGLIILSNLVIIIGFIVARDLIKLNLITSIIILLALTSIISFIFSKLVIAKTTDPLKAVWQAVWHISPNGKDVAAPNTNNLAYGRELATVLVNQIYQLTGGGNPVGQVDQSKVTISKNQDDLLDLLPIPIIGIDSNNKIVSCNKPGFEYIAKDKTDCIGGAINDVLQLSFHDNNTLENWIESSRQNALTSINSWDRVRLQLSDDKGLKQFDLIARFSKDNSSGIETFLAIFDHTSRYNDEDNSTAYVALAVHELRTPLTVLRGYIEVFEEELEGKLTPELNDFMHKMKASAQTLTAFVSNILNVARVDENELNLSLHEANWNELLTEIANDLKLRTEVRGKNIVLNISPNLPTVAVDKVSIYEVLSNLVDNAIKYGGNSKDITIHARITKDGSIETIVQDQGVGIPESSFKHLFTKFYRSHRSKGSVGGSGLGLYLVKAIVSAHGGHVSVQSKEGVGSQFGFTLQPYSSVAAELQDTPGGNIERQAHGWIKNHSIYRR